MFLSTKVNRKVEEEPQAEVAANSCHQEKEKKVTHIKLVHSLQTYAR